MRPLRSFLLILIFLAGLTGLHYVAPDGRLFPSAEEFLPEGSIGLLKSLIRADYVVVTKTEAKPSVISQPDSVAIEKTSNPDLLSFFHDSLYSSGGQTRIIYYGDSQIEGDRFTSYIRHTLQSRYSGSGPGLFLPLMPVMYTKSIVLKSSPNWIKYNYLSFRNKEISHNNLGPFMALCRFLPEGTVADANVTAYVNITPSSFADTLSSRYDMLRLFYSAPDGPVAFTVRADGQYVCREALLRTREINEVRCNLKGARIITLEFTGKVSPDIYGISIESDKGIIVDNIPQRGSAGLEFTMTDSASLGRMYRFLAPDLFILQYGLNIVRNVREEYNYYQKGLERQIAFLNKVAPGVPVVVVGVTDMASSEEGDERSFNNIPAIIDAQKKASAVTGAMFWDSYDAMGGDSSIIRWSERKPALAQKDLVHFTYAGADTLAKYLTDYLFPAKSADTVKYQDVTAVSEKDSIEAPSFSMKAGDAISVPGRVFRMIFSYDPERPMIFSTAAFWFFLLLVLAGYSIVYRKKGIRNSYLLLVSLFFYYKSGGLFLMLLLLVTVVDYTCGLLIYNARTRSLKKLFILLSIISNLGILAYFKYTGFFIEVFNDITGADLQVHDYLASLSNNILGTAFDISNIMLPVGISFFTFQSLSYTFDVYRSRMEPVRNIIDFGFYVSFFPQLVAGPIVRASEFIPQLYADFHLSKREFSHALFLISKGLIKKIIISDFIAVNFVDRVFDTPSLFSGFENLMAIYGYGLQIYCDFSGYTDIAIGLGLIFGFRFPVNFNSPYKATGVSDFWKRWHISLSRWLKDYLYISLGGNRKGKIRTNINLLITMLLGGLWHGASLRFIIWGGLHGVGLIVNRIWDNLTKGRFKGGWFGKFLAIFITFNFVSFCWIFFRAPDLASVGIMLNQIWSAFSPGSYMTVIPAYGNVFMLILAGYTIHLLPENIKESYRGLFIKIPVVVQLATVFLVAVLLYQMKTSDVMPFIYFRF
jgi:D-alanyl-lipoteichoic acid acyltransferase DltB (MBOAT superfamily)/lysophospholipase L1-like esterase